MSGGTVCAPEDQRTASASVPAPHSGLRPSAWSESARARSEACADRSTGGFAPCHGRTSFSVVPVRKGSRQHSARHLTDLSPRRLARPRSPTGRRGRYRASHGPELPTRSREIQDRDRRMAQGQPAARLGRTRFLHDARRTHGLQRSMDGQAVRRRMDLRQLADGVRRQGPEPPATGRAERRVRPCRRTAARRLLRRHARRPDDPAVGHRRTEAAVHRRDPEGRDRLVPGVQRTRRRVGPGRPQDAGGARRRRVGHQRPEGLDDAGALRRLHLPARPHRPRRAEARRHLLPPRPHEAAGRRGATHRADRRLGRIQRGLLHQRALPEGQRHRRRQQRVEGRHDDARVRARHVVDHRAPPLPEGVRPDPRRGTSNGDATATHSSASAWRSHGRRSRSCRSTATAR